MNRINEIDRILEENARAIELFKTLKRDPKPGNFRKLNRQIKKCDKMIQKFDS